MNAADDMNTNMKIVPTADDFAAARAALLERFENCAEHLNYTAPHSSSVDTSDAHALTLRVGKHGYFTFHHTPDGPAYAWWYPASRAPVSDHHIVGDPVPVVRTALLDYMRRAKSELG